MKVKVLTDHCNRPYLARLELLSLFGWSLKLHIFIRSDADPELHDHPWPFWSFILAGKYDEEHEVVRCDLAGERQDFDFARYIRTRRAGSLNFFPATWRHRVLLIDGEPCATLVLTKPKSREWGFWRGRMFTPWRAFVSSREC